MSTPTTIVNEITAIEIIKEAITNHLTMTMAPPSPQPTMPLLMFPLTITIPSPQDSAVHINDRDPSPFTLHQPLPDSTLDSPIDYDWMEEDKENDNLNDPRLPFFPNNPALSWYYPLYIQLDNPLPDGPAHVLAKYIFYHKKGQEVIGCMGKVLDKQSVIVDMSVKPTPCTQGHIA